MLTKFFTGIKAPGLGGCSGYNRNLWACVQTGIRGDETNARAWEGLGAAYQALNRLTAATKAHFPFATI